MSLGRLAWFSDKGAAVLAGRGESLFEAPKGDKKLSANVHGFNIEAGVVLEQHNRAALERLCRYLLRPAVSLERMRITLTGQVAYKLKYPRKGATHLLLDPLEFVGRVAGLIAPPRLVHLRYAGVLAPHHKLRGQVVRLAVPAPRQHPTPHRQRRRTSTDRRTTAAAPKLRPYTMSVLVAPSPAVQAAEAGSEPLTALGHGVLPMGPYIPWAELLKRTFSFDVLRCSCGGTRRVVDFVIDPEIVRQILARFGLPIVPPPLARARDPAWQPPSMPAADD
jgi:hypothetical protein